MADGRLKAAARTLLHKCAESRTYVSVLYSGLPEAESRGFVTVEHVAKQIPGHEHCYVAITTDGLAWLIKDLQQVLRRRINKHGDAASKERA